MSMLVMMCGNVFDGFSDALTGPAEILIGGNRIAKVERCVRRPPGARVIGRSEGRWVQRAGASAPERSNFSETRIGFGRAPMAQFMPPAQVENGEGLALLAHLAPALRQLLNRQNLDWQFPSIVREIVLVKLAASAVVGAAGGQLWMTDHTEPFRPEQENVVSSAEVRPCRR